MRGIRGVRLVRKPGRMPGRQRRSAGWSAAAAVVLFVVYALVLGRGAARLDGDTLRGLTASQRASEIDAMRGYLIQIGAGVLAAGALLYTALNFQLAREGHVTERYTKAIEQLGSAGLDVRLGAIYALERVMIDSARDHPTIVEVLAAFVREHAPTAGHGSVPDDGGKPKEVLPPATDVQAAITVLARRPAERDERGPVDLAHAKLTVADLARADLARANLLGADLNHADLTGADLTDALLNSANLDYARLNGAFLEEAELNGASLTGASLNNAHLPQAQLNRALLHGTKLRGANLTNADLSDATLNGADLNGAQLNGANLTGAQLIGADLTSADLPLANLTGADLTNANLTGTDLTGVVLTDKQWSAAHGAPAMEAIIFAPASVINPDEQQAPPLGG